MVGRILVTVATGYHCALDHLKEVLPPGEAEQWPELAAISLVLSPESPEASLARDLLSWCGEMLQLL